MSIRMDDLRTGDFAQAMERMVDGYFMGFEIANHGIAIERTNASSITLLRYASSNEGRKIVTLKLGTPGNLPSKEDVRLETMLRRVAGASHDWSIPTTDEEWTSETLRFLTRALRANLRRRAVLECPPSGDNSAWTHTVHPLVKAWMEQEGYDLAEVMPELWTNKIKRRGAADVGNWHFIDGYATCEGVVSRDKSVMLSGAHGTRAVTLSIGTSIPEVVIPTLVGKPLSALGKGKFLDAGADLEILACEKTSRDGADAVRATIAPAEVLLSRPPRGFRTDWTVINDEEKPIWN